MSSKREWPYWMSIGWSHLFYLAYPTLVLVNLIPLQTGIMTNFTNPCQPWHSFPPCRGYKWHIENRLLVVRTDQVLVQHPDDVTGPQVRPSCWDILDMVFPLYRGGNGGSGACTSQCYSVGSSGANICAQIYLISLYNFLYNTFVSPLLHLFRFFVLPAWQFDPFLPEIRPSWTGCKQ